MNSTLKAALDLDEVDVTKASLLHHSDWMYGNRKSINLHQYLFFLVWNCFNELIVSGQSPLTLEEPHTFDKSPYF